MKKSNMYSLSVKQLNLHVGCEYECSYCKPSFQRMLKRFGKKRCQQCYRYAPHQHLERTKHALPRTDFMQFIFLNSSGDVSFCPTPELQRMMDWVGQHPNRTFLMQSKNPRTFSRVKIPENVILGTTVETDRHYFTDLAERIYAPNEKQRVVSYMQISHAPHPLQRVSEFAAINHKLKMLTYEPILYFNTEGMIKIAEQIQPCMIWLGMDSRPQENKLPEPSLEKVRELHWELSKRGFVVILKTIRKAWWQK